MDKISNFIVLMLFLFGNSENPASVLIQYRLIQFDRDIPENGKLSRTLKNGKEIYRKFCLSCHQKDGSGVPNTYPPLIRSTWVKGNKTKLILVLLNGLEGEITVNEDYYNGYMPKQNKLSDKKIASVLTFIRQSFNNASSVVSPKEVKALRGK
ncbi:MAG: cytochrome c [Bacteroidota bacterium]|nr:cytochrome c [Bacteroidota bacterium]